MGSLLDFFSFDNISIDSNACMNHLNKEIVCLDCVSHCPTNAIKLVNKTPVIKHSACINCGLCVSTCSVLAVDHIQKPYLETSKKIREYENSHITCDQFENYQKGIKVPCYTYLDLPLVLELGANNNELTLYSGKCKSCSKSEKVDIEKHILNIKDELEKYQVPITIQLLTTELDDTNDQLINGLTRRELFKKFSMKNLKEIINEKEGVPKKEIPHLTLPLHERIKYKRKILTKHLNHHVQWRPKINREINKMSMSLEITNSCNGCNVCEKVCPSNALSWQNEGEISSLYFSVQDCIGCKKCKACPEEAIQFEHLTLNEYLEQKDPISLKTFNVKECKECGDQFRTKEEIDICPICQSKEQNVSNRFFAHYLE